MRVGFLWSFLAGLATAVGFFAATNWFTNSLGMERSELSPIDPSLQSTSSFAGAPCGFFDFFQNKKTGPGVHKWVHYFNIYEEHFGRFCRGTANITMAEIGIQSGGSLQMWRHAFGAKLELLVGMDTNPDTKAWEEFGPNIHVEVGSQADPEYLKDIKEKYPQGFDILLDDGSHFPHHQFITFAHMWKHIRPGGVFLIEDVHGQNALLDWLLHGHNLDEASWPGIYYANPMVNWKCCNQERGDLMNRYMGPVHTTFNASEVQKEIESIKVYPFVVAITRRKVPMVQMRAEKHGTQWIPYGKR